MRLHFWIHSGDSAAQNAGLELASAVGKIPGSRSVSTRGSHPGPVLGRLIEYSKGTIYDLTFPESAPEAAEIIERYTTLIADKTFEKI